MGEIYKRNDVDLIICEYFRNIVEIEWAIEVALEFNLPVAATMCMGPCGDENGVSVGECAVRMARAGAQIVGTNCLFDPFSILDVMRDMKEALKLFNLSPYLMAQPNGYRCPDGGTFGWVQIPEFPFAVEPRQITRWEARKWAREAYNIGVKNIPLKDIADMLKKRQDAMRVKPTDVNAATHLIRNALGGTAYGVDHSRLSQMLSLPQDMVRMFRDDITIQVVFFDEEYLRTC